MIGLSSNRVLHCHRWVVLFRRVAPTQQRFECGTGSPGEESSINVIQSSISRIYEENRWICNLNVSSLQTRNFKHLESWNFQFESFGDLKYLRILNKFWILENLKYRSKNNVQRFIRNKNFEMIILLRCSWHFRRQNHH